MNIVKMFTLVQILFWINLWIVPGTFLNSRGMRLTILQFKQCTNPSSKWPMQSLLHKFNRTTVAVDWNITLTEDLDDSLVIDLEVKRWGNGGWKNNFIVITKNHACHLMLNNSITKPMVDGFAVSKCPIKKGSYEIKNTVFSELPSMVHFKGKFWCVVKLKTTTGEVKWCIDVILQLDED